jgi:hypothetical protein
VIRLDTQANVSIFKNAHLLTNVRNADQPLEVSGINSAGPDLVATSVGEFRDFGTVWLHPSAAGNILAHYPISKNMEVEWDAASTTFTAHAPDGPYTFSPVSGGLYTCDLTDRDSYASQVTTVKSQEQLFTAREVERAKGARELIQKLGYPSSRSVGDMVTSGALINCPFTVKDIDRAYQIYGPDLGSLRGKTTKTPGEPYKEKYLPRVVQREQTLHVDLMFVNGHASLIAVGAPLALTVCVDLGRKANGRAKGPIRTALFSVVNQFTSEKFRVTTLLTDGEGAIASLKSELQGCGIATNPAGPGQHVPVIERKIREIKERVRAVVTTLPWRTPALLVASLIAFAVARINLVPHRGGLINVSPREAFLGIKADFNLVARCSFGDYAECTPPVTDNSMKPRTQPCIALCPVGTQGSHHFFSLDTCR